MVMSAETHLGSTNGLGPDNILVVVLIKCKPKLSYILVHPFHKCWKKYGFPDWWEV